MIVKILLPTGTPHFLKREHLYTWIEFWWTIPGQTWRSQYHNLWERLRQGRGRHCPSSCWCCWCCPAGSPPCSPPLSPSLAPHPQPQRSLDQIPAGCLESRDRNSEIKTWGTGVLLYDECWLWCCPCPPCKSSHFYFATNYCWVNQFRPIQAISLKLLTWLEVKEG